MPQAKAASRLSNMGTHKGGAYVDRDKPAQIRFSNISAAKGRIKELNLFKTRLIWSKISTFIALGWAGRRYSLSFEY